jgi:hypothetical protein
MSIVKVESICYNKGVILEIKRSQLSQYPKTN